jgi:pimeloyl-ACP methyl ester carboxylesterase
MAAEHRIEEKRVSPTAPGCKPASRNAFVRLRGIDYHLRQWGDPHGQPLLLLHGARDCAATFQFVVQALKGQWHIVAPDWRGHGHSDRAPQAYWVHDFMADLDALLETVFPDVTPDVVGHSMGGNVAGLYIGLRPRRIRRFVSLDGLGPPAHRFPVDMTATLNDFLKHRPKDASRGYGALEDVVVRLRKANHRLTEDKAAFLAAHSTSQGEDGRWRWLFDSGMKRSFPTLHTIDEWAGIWSRVEIPVRWIGSSDIRKDAPSFDDDTVAQRRRLLPQAEYTRLENTGHNIHHDRPEDVALLIEEFLLRDRT